MAKSINEYQEILLDAKDEAVELEALEVLTENEVNTLGNVDSTSRVSIWRLWIWLFAYAMHLIDSDFDEFREEITAIVEANRPHGVNWYLGKALAFQYGHNLVNDDEYEEIDVDAQIVKQAAVEEEDRLVVVKVATLDGEDLVKIDDTDVVTALISYLNAVKDAGTQIELVNKDADLLKLDMTVVYDPLIMTSEGKLTSDSGTYPVFNPNLTRNADGNWDAIQFYLRSTDFNGEYLINKQIDEIQSAAGVIDVEFHFAGFKTALLSDYLEFTRAYKPLAGYMKPEDITINYVANV